jgi:hypothetical protein
MIILITGPDRLHEEDRDCNFPRYIGISTAFDLKGCMAAEELPERMGNTSH